MSYLKLQNLSGFVGTDYAQAFDVVVDSQGNVKGYYFLDAFGTIHSAGNVPPLTGGPYWPTKNVARGLAVVKDAKGSVLGAYVMDNAGNIYAIGGVGDLPGPVGKGTDFCTLRLMLNATGGIIGAYALEYGAALVHPLAGSPSFAKSTTIQNDFETPPGLFGRIGYAMQTPDLALAANGYYVLSLPGGVYPCGSVPLFGQKYGTAPAWYHEYTSLFRAASPVLDSNGKALGLYIADKFGNVTALGSAPVIAGLPKWSTDMLRAIQVVQDAQGNVMGLAVMDAQGNVTFAGTAGAEAQWTAMTQQAWSASQAAVQTQAQQVAAVASLSSTAQTLTQQAATYQQQAAVAQAAGQTDAAATLTQQAAQAQQQAAAVQTQIATVQSQAQAAAAPAQGIVSSTISKLTSGTISPYLIAGAAALAVGAVIYFSRRKKSSTRRGR